MAGQTMPAELVALPKWVIGMANAGIIIVVYGLCGLAGYWLMKRSGLPGLIHPKASWREWFLLPLGLGTGIGVFFVILDRIFAAQLTGIELPHPAFPLSLIASATAGIGEEIMFRFFVMGLWIFLLNLVLRRWKAKRVAFWIANVFAALAFAASHLPAVMYLFDVSNPMDLPMALLVEIVLLNGILGLVAGERMAKTGLVAAIGIHFWADVVWHVIWPLL